MLNSGAGYCEIATAGREIEIKYIPVSQQTTTEAKPDQRTAGKSSPTAVNSVRSDDQSNKNRVETATSTHTSSASVTTSMIYFPFEWKTSPGHRPVKTTEVWSVPTSKTSYGLKVEIQNKTSNGLEQVNKNYRGTKVLYIQRNLCYLKKTSNEFTFS